jgi:hypothetical protein
LAAPPFRKRGIGTGSAYAPPFQAAWLSVWLIQVAYISA